VIRPTSCASLLATHSSQAPVSSVISLVARPARTHFSHSCENRLQQDYNRNDFLPLNRQPFARDLSRTGDRIISTPTKPQHRQNPEISISLATACLPTVAVMALAAAEEIQTAMTAMAAASQMATLLTGEFNSPHITTFHLLFVVFLLNSAVICIAGMPPCSFRFRFNSPYPTSFYLNLS
jgi:hypothetical protein